VIGYDDWWVLPCGEGNFDYPLLVGEGRAHAEAAEKWGATFKCVGGPCFSWDPVGDPACDAWLARSSWGVLFEVTAVGDFTVGRQEPSALVAPARHGFELAPAEVARFVARNALCKEIRSDGAVYTLRPPPPSAEAARALEAEVAARSGVSLRIDAPPAGLKGWVPGPGPDPGPESSVGAAGVAAAGVAVSISVDVSEDGADSRAVRKDPTKFMLCYQAAPPPAPLTRPAQDEAAATAAPRAGPGAAAAAAVEGALYAPRCHPLVRGGGQLENVLVPPPGGGGGGGGPTGQEGASASSAWVSAWVQEGAADGAARLGLVSVELGPPASNPAAAWPAASPVEEEEVKEAAAVGEGSESPAVLRVLSPAAGAAWAESVVVSVEVDVSAAAPAEAPAAAPGLELLARDPGQFEVCYAARPAPKLRQFQYPSLRDPGEQAGGSWGGVTCFPLIAPPTELPPLQLASPAKANEAKVAGRFAGVEVWLRGRKTPLGESPVVVGRTFVPLALP